MLCQSYGDSVGKRLLSYFTLQQVTRGTVVETDEPNIWPHTASPRPNPVRFPKVAAEAAAALEAESVPEPAPISGSRVAWTGCECCCL